ncbi:Subtilisin-like protease SBT5 [Arachis hypogaea]|nr:Subtilisin-like protease SBT5 [Arachis hypogaea]
MSSSPILNSFQHHSSLMKMACNLLHSWHHSPPEGPTQSHLRSFKPDVTTPESTSLLPARKQLPPTEIPFDKRRVAFITMSRTSMSCPHVAGIAGLLKTLRPEWRPSAIKSAIMTSARTRNKGDEPMFDGDFKTVTPYAYGFSHSQIMAFSEARHHDCPDGMGALDFTYPSITVPHLWLV